MAIIEYDPETDKKNIEIAINKYQINLHTIASIVEDFGQLAEILSPSGAVAWLKEHVTIEKESDCDWCDGGAMDLVYNYGTPRAWGEVDKETGIMSFGIEKQTIASRKVKYCPMCGKRIGLQNTL